MPRSPSPSYKRSKTSHSSSSRREDYSSRDDSSRSRRYDEDDRRHGGRSERDRERDYYSGSRDGRDNRDSDRRRESTRDRYDDRGHDDRREREDRRHSSSRRRSRSPSPVSSRNPSNAEPAPAVHREPTEEEIAAQKKAEKLEKLAKWKAEQAAKKAAAGAASPMAPLTPTSAPTTPLNGNAASNNGSFLSLKQVSPSPSPTLPPLAPSSSASSSSFSLPSRPKTTKLVSTSLSRFGLPMKPSTLRGSMTMMDDGPAPVRKLEKLGALPAVDTTLVHLEDDEEELDREFVTSVKGKDISAELESGLEEAPAATVPVEEAMDVDSVPPTPEVTIEAAPMDDEDEEEDPLEAYMRGVTAEKVKVDKEDDARMAGQPGAKSTRARALGMEDDAADGEDEEEDVGEKKDDEMGALTAEEIVALAAKKNKRKELPTVDHEKAVYEPFRKQFYTTPPYEIQQLTEEEVELMRLEMDGIKIRGIDCPRPVKRWGAFGLPGGCLEVIKRLGYTAPTSIQAQAIPAIMSGRDVIGVAKTGSGKTIAFMLPLLRHIKDQRPLESGEGPLAIVMTPTRELALQIVKEVKPFAKVLGLTAMCAYGGSPISEQIAEMKKGAEIVVCTPGRMIDLLTANGGRVTNLKRVTYLVLDEADRMFDMGFEPQVMKIINNVRPDRQVVLFSATFPKQMDALARKILDKPLEVTVGGRSVVAKEITQIVEVRSEDTKFHRLLELLGETYQAEADMEEKRTLIFVERQESADNLLLELHQRGYRRSNSLHGGKEQVDRDQTINSFKSGVIPIVIATSVAARGLDVKQLVLVVNYDVPNHMEDYVHRAGRTGRAGNKGTCVTFITPEQEKYSVDICRAVEASGVEPPAELKALSEGFLAKVRSGAAKSHTNTGFGGKGLDKFDDEREAKEKAQRSLYGEKTEEKTKEEAVDEDGVKIETGKAAADEPALPGFNVEIVKGPAPERVGNAPAPSSNKGPVLLTTNRTDNPQIAAAMAKINAQLAKKPTAAPSTPTPSTAGIISTDRKPKDPDATDFHAVIQINDFTQKARWMVTNRESISKLIDMTGTAVTNRGIYYEPGKEVPPGGEPKLSLLIESNDEWRVEMAVKEIRRLLIEGTVSAMAQEQRAGGGGGGRYTVI